MIFRSLLIVLLLAAQLPVFAAAAEPKESLRKDSEAAPEGDNLFNLIFGSPPPMPTQRGILIIAAFHDRNGNQIRDPKEELLQGEVSCRIDEIDYTVPAFIPGLRLHGNFPVNCRGGRYRPTQKQDVFIERRGQIVHLDLPCESVEVTTR